MAKWLVAIMMGFCMAIPVLVQAQSPVTLDSVKIDLWPEYDRPEMLVIYHIFLPANTSLPARLTLRIPSEAKNPSSLAYRDPSGELYNLDFTRSETTQWISIIFSSPAKEIQLEYYDPRLVKNGTTRAFTYTWPGDYDVSRLSFQVQQPVSATAMKITPETGEGLSDGSGLVYYDDTIGAIKAGQEPAIVLSYEKPNDDLSIQALSVGPSAPINSQTPGRSTLGRVLPWVFGGVALLLIGGGGYWLWQSRRMPQPGQIHRHAARSTRPKSAAQPATPGEAFYCHHCGRRAAPDDIFCRACGVRLKR